MGEEGTRLSEKEFETTPEKPGKLSSLNSFIIDIIAFFWRIHNRLP